LAKAREFTDRGLKIAASTDSRKNLVKAWRLRGEIALAHRELEEAEIAVRQALGVARAIGNPTQLWKTQFAWGRVCAARGRPDEAGDAYRAARTVLDRVKTNLQDPALRATLEQVPAIRQMYDLTGSQ
jgi:tetratricopeptide (TPR) repeat protein